MKKPEHVTEADIIGEELLPLWHYHRLPDTATACDQIVALREDKLRLACRVASVQGRIERLIKSIEDGGE
jgi:hypothetical protein